MGNKGKNRRPRTQRPVNPGQQELVITRRLMESAVIERARVQEQAQLLQMELRQMQIVTALLLERLGGVAEIADASVEALNVEGIQTDRDDTRGVTILTLVAGPPLDEDE